MQNSINGYERVRLSELRIVTRAVGFLALLTGFLYLRVAVAEGAFAVQENETPLIASLLLLLFILGTAGLLVALRWDGVGGGTAVFSGIGLTILFFTIGRGWLDAFFYGSPFLIAGLLFLGCLWQMRRKAR